jgi:hypothetical protein
MSIAHFQSANFPETLFAPVACPIPGIEPDGLSSSYSLRYSTAAAGSQWSQLGHFEWKPHSRTQSVKNLFNCLFLPAETEHLKETSMHQNTSHVPQEPSTPDSASISTPQPITDTSPKKQWQAPKLAFVDPVLKKHGNVTEVTGQFFGGFTPA